MTYKKRIYLDAFTLPWFVFNLFLMIISVILMITKHWVYIFAVILCFIFMIIYLDDMFYFIH
jgi:hypothetical protein